MKTVTLNRFDGIVNDPRTQNPYASKVCTNFDISTDRHRAIPHRDSENGNSAADDNEIQNFTVALSSGSSYRLFGLGVVTGQAYARILYKNLGTGGSNDLDDGGWTETANNTDSSGFVNFNTFVYYKKTGLIYGARSNRYIFAYDPTGSASFAPTHRDLTSYTNIAQGLVHSKDDILYIPYDNKIEKNDNGSWSTALTLPSDLRITSIAEYGNFLAIACAPLSGYGRSVVFLWNRDSSLTTLTERIDWGEEFLHIIEEVEGILVGISYLGSDASILDDRVIFRYYQPGVGAVKIQELVGALGTTPRSFKQKFKSRLYFTLSITLNGSIREGVWSIGRDTERGGFTLVHERTPNNDTALVSPILYGFYFIGDFLFQTYNTSSTFGMSKSNDQDSYTATSTIETAINPGVDSSDFFKKKQLMRASVITEPLPASGQVVLDVRVDGGSWQTVMTRTTDNEIAFGTGILSDGTSLPQGREFEFRIKSTGGAVLTGLEYVYKVLESHIGV